MKNLLLEEIIKRVRKNILSEGAIDKPTLEISREIVRIFKKGKNSTFTYTFSRSGEDIELLVDVTIEVEETHNEPFEIYAEAAFDELYVTIIYDPQAFPKNMNDLVAEIKETVTHELEHIIQQNFEEDYIHPDLSDYYDDKRGGKYNYFLKKIEIPAFIKGLIKRSKTKKITLDQAMDEWYRENHRNFESLKDWKDVKKIWMDWATENLTKQKVKKFK